MEHLIEPHTRRFENEWHYSHVVRARGLLFLSGVTGPRKDGHVAEDPEDQFEQLFVQLKQCLHVAGAGI